MARKIKLPLKYAVNTIDNNETINNYDLISVSLNKKIYSQDEMAILIEGSIGTIFIVKDNLYIPLSKEESHFIDINELTVIIKVPVDFNSDKMKSHITSNDKKSSNSNNREKKFNRTLLCESSIHGSSSSSGFLGYGLDLI